LFQREKHEVTVHEHYREICAAASIGQATPEELFEFEQHAAECEACQQIYFDYLNLAGTQYAEANQKPVLTSERAQESLNSELFTRRFFERAEREGIQFSKDVGEEVESLTPPPRALPRRIAWRFPVGAIAAALLVSVGLSGGYFYGRRSEQRTLEAKNARVANPVAPLDGHVTELTAANARLEVEIGRLKSELAKASESLNATQTNLHLTTADQEELKSDRAALEAQLQVAQQQLAQSQTLLASAQQDAARRDSRANDLQATLVASNVKISDLTDELAEKSALLDKERQLLALNRDVTNLMAERNLHVVDVVDTDPRGKTRPAFGRVFFAENKVLEFYAYDLNEGKLQKANYQYHVWAKQEGGDKQVRSLGIFYSDNKEQRRWKFQCNDPHILREIDSVFVTLEPTDSDPKHPKGQNLMYAYLRGQPNHP
jgi:uncharacterized small protein (DUF1192 family)